MTTMTVTSTINRQYLKNKTKDEIIDLLLYILDTRCEADAKIEIQYAAISRLRGLLNDMYREATKQDAFGCEYGGILLAIVKNELDAKMTGGEK